VTMNKATVLDGIDKRILHIVQNDASLSIYEIAQLVGLSQTPCWKRLQRLRASGVIKRRVELLDPVKLGLGTTVFVFIQIGDHSGESLARFAADVAAMGEVMEFYRVAGNVDYVLHVIMPDTAAFDRFYKRLIKLTQLKNVTSCFSLEDIKSVTAFPIPR
jgi:Lrp/AsnC family transcriptional regulator